MRRLVVLGGVLAVLAGSLALLQLRPPAPAASGPPAATLVVLTGSAQVTRAGSAIATIARGGDQLRRGDQVSTGPGSRARLTFAGGDQVRLDSGTSISIVAGAPAAVEVRQSAGRTWVRNLSGGRVTVSAAGRLYRSQSRGDEFAVDLTVPPPAAVDYAGEVEGARPGTDADLGSPWAALNRALDRDPSPGGPAALGAGMLLPGEQSSAQQGASVQPGSAAQDVVFTADWTAGSLELEVIDPDGQVFGHVQGPNRPLSLVVPSARPGGWGYRVRQLAGGEAGNSWFVVISQVVR
ncbi:MAG TPA: hypothetical protein VNG93_00660 [Candidatus Dormibacteraeota bacterium]|nr:hypothetical protein [Candidatus Dormibacteraeota bacterium]